MLALRPVDSIDRRASRDEPGLVEENRGRASVLCDSRAVVFLTGIFLMSVVFYQHEGAMPLFLVRDLHYRASF